MTGDTPYVQDPYINRLEERVERTADEESQVGKEDHMKMLSVHLVTDVMILYNMMISI